MGYVVENLMAGESVVYSARLHRFMFVPPAVLFVVGVFVVAAARGEQSLFVVSAIGGLLIAGAIVAFFIRLVDYNTSEFAVTTKRVIIKVGLIRRRTLELLLSKVETVGVDQTILGRLFGFGTIVVTGTGGTKEPFSHINEPMEFRRHVQEQTAQAPAPAPGPVYVPSSAPVAGGGIFCTTCGAKNAAGSNFCAACGIKFAPA